MSTFRSLNHDLGERIDVADCVNGSGIRLSIADPEWSTPRDADGCTLLDPDEARHLARLLFQAAAKVDESRAYQAATIPASFASLEADAKRTDKRGTR